jgi:predicted membrane protein
LQGLRKEGIYMRLLLRLNLFYGTFALLVWGGYQLVPDLHRYLPIGVVDTLFNQGEDSDIGGIVIHASNVVDEVGGLIWLVTAIIGAVALMIPVSWTYMAVRSKSKMDQSLLETLLVLPIAVTGIVLIVHNSLAMAFSLAGVVAGVRYRTALKSTADSLFIFLAVGVGLSAGVGMLLVAAVMSAIFNYTFLILWEMNYGGYEDAKTYMRQSPREIERQKAQEQEKDTGIFE